MLSPFMFIFYLNEIIKLSIKNNCRGIFIDNDHPNIPMLLYADDLVLLGDTIGGVQKLLDTLSEFCDKWGLKVNLSKTKQMVFRNGGIIKKNEILYLNGVKLETVSYYKYLGIVISTRLSWSPAQSTLSAQASKAINMINQMNFKCNYSFKTSCEIFDKCALPILTYGSEIWGTDIHSSIENVHFKFCKKQLGVGCKSPSPAVIGDCGRGRIYLACYLKCVKYWLKIIAMPEGSLVKACYILLYNQCNLGKLNWASKVKQILNQYGFGYVWEGQSVNDVNSFLCNFKTRLSDCELQWWSDQVGEMSKLQTYKLFKTERNVESYLLLSIPRRLRVAIAKFRISNHDLEVEKGRHYGIKYEDRLCKLCGQFNKIHIENEYHVLFECKAYYDIRKLYIVNHVANVKTLNSFLNLMKSDDVNCIINLANFVCSMNKIRNLKMQELNQGDT